MKAYENYVGDAERALTRSEHMVNDGAYGGDLTVSSDLRAIREAVVAVASELGAIRLMLERRAT